MGAQVVDAHPMTIDYLVTKNKIYPKPAYIAFLDGTVQSEFSENEIYGGYGAVARRGNVNNGVHVIKDNYIENGGYIYGGIGSGIGDSLTITSNYLNTGLYRYAFRLNTESFRNITISGNHFGNLSGRGVDLTYLISGVNLEISNNTFENIENGGVYINGNSFTNGVVAIQNNILRNVYTSGSGSAITIVHIQNASICGNQISDTTNSTQYGIFEGTGSYNNSIFGNIITGMSVGNIYKNVS
jgi:hypothetical protein